TKGHWQPANLPGAIDRIDAVAISPVDDQVRLFSGIRHIMEEPYYENVIGHWSEQGWILSWNRDYGASRLVPHPTDKNRWYSFITSSAIAVSEDGGQSWQLRLTGRHDPTDSPPSLQSLAVTERGIYLYGFKTLLFSDDDGISWTDLSVPPSGLDPQQFYTNFTGAIFAGPNNSLLIANEDGVWWRSEDHEEWQSLGLRGETVLDVAVGGQSDQTVYANVGLRIVALQLSQDESVMRYLPYVVKSSSS
ncbi:MAG: hypothetical protein KDE58_16325, partial [Caldilineaceae bacterium]|nr:hypothetical protein [Caldilineaceae bacterium]